MAIPAPLPRTRSGVPVCVNVLPSVLICVCCVFSARSPLARKQIRSCEFACIDTARSQPKNVLEELPMSL